MAKFPWHNLMSFYTIKSRITVAFGITIAVLLLVAFVSLAAISILQANINQFVAGDLHNIRNVDQITHIVPSIVSSTTQLFEVSGKESLQRIYNTMDDELLTLEKTTNELSRQGHSTASQLLDILFLSQQIRSEAQLSVQLISAAFDTEQEFQRIHDQIYQVVDIVHGEIYHRLSNPNISTSPRQLKQVATLNKDLQLFFDFIEKLEYTPQTFLETAGNKQKIAKVFVNIQAFTKNLEKETLDSRHQQIYRTFNQLDLKTIVDLRNAEIQYRETSNAIYINLKKTVHQLDEIGEKYLNIMLSDFEKKTTFINVLKTWLQSLLMAIVVLALIIISSPIQI
jgi:hypothetical protein